MILTVSLTGFQSLVPDQDQARTLETGALSIGRGPQATWVLPDPKRFLSKTHCRLEARDGVFVLVDLSTNGTFVNGSEAALGPQGEHALADGDTILIGEYELAVAIGAAPRQPARSAPSVTTATGPVDLADGRDPFGIEQDFAPRAQAPEPEALPGWTGQAGNADPFGAPPSAGRDPLGEDLLGGDPLAPPGGGGGSLDDILGPTGGAPSATFDPFAPPAGLSPDPIARATGGGGALGDDLDFLGGAPAPWEGGGGAPVPDQPSQRDDGLRGSDFFRAPEVVRQDKPADLIPADWDDDLLGGPVSPPASPSPPERPSEATPVAAPEPPPQPHPRPPPPLEAAATPSDLEPAQRLEPRQDRRRPEPAPDATDTAALLEAFLEGAGVDVIEARGRVPMELMRELGHTFGLMVEGMREVLAARAAIKNEYRIQKTTLQKRNNNPLKFSVSQAEAVRAMIRGEDVGYSGPEASVRDAFDDIRSHQLAVMAGVQATVTSILERFDPDNLESRLTRGSVLDSVMPSARKAKLWELFAENYKALVDEVRGDALGQFGSDFARSYEDQERDR